MGKLLLFPVISGVHKNPTYVAVYEYTYMGDNVCVCTPICNLGLFVPGVLTFVYNDQFHVFK
jgi:hypothetical protein